MTVPSLLEAIAETHPQVAETAWRRADPANSVVNLGPQVEVAKAQPLIFSADETAGVGQDDSTTVTTDYKQNDNSFTGKIPKVVVEVKEMGAAVKASAAVIATARGAFESAK